MENKKTCTRRALILSMITLIICASLLIGTTFAWFSDTIVSRGNRIQAGNLKVGFTSADTISEESGDLTDVNLVDLADSESKLFNLTNWAPGDTYTRYIKVKSIGSLAIKYDIDFVLSGLNDTLASAIMLDVTPSTNAPTVTNGSVIGSAAEGVEMSGALFNQDDFQVFKLDLKFLESSGTTYNDLTADFGLDVILTATQTNSNATIINARTAADFAKATANSTVVLQNDITLGNDVTISNLCNINLNGYNIIGNLGFVSQSIGTIDISGGNINGTLTLNTPNATINHYNSVTDVNIIAVANNSYHEHGTTEMITVTKGRVVAETGAQIAIIRLEENANPNDSNIMLNGGTVDKVEGDIAVLVNSTFSLKVAIASAMGGQIISIAKDFTLDEIIVFDKENVSLTIDLCGKTINSDGKIGRMFNLKNGNLTIISGTLNAVGTYVKPGSNADAGSGAYGSISASGGTLNLKDLTLNNYRPWGLNVKLNGGYAVLRNVDINSQYGGGIEISGAKADIYDCTFTQSLHNDWCSTNVSVSYGGILNVYGSTFTGEKYSVYVFSSGGTINLNGGTYSAETVLKADLDLNSYPDATATINIAKGVTLVGNQSIGAGVVVNDNRDTQTPKENI